VEDSGDGPAVVFLHGLAGFKELWAEIVPAVHEAGFRTIAYDHRGHGESGDPLLPWTIDDFADDLASLLDQLRVDRACLVGHSMGGRVLFQFALSRPDRVWAIVPVGAHSEPPRSPYRDLLVDLRDATLRKGLREFRRTFDAIGEIPKRILDDPVFAAEFEVLFARNRPEALVAALDAIFAMPTLTPRLGEISVPTLPFVGESDAHFRDLSAYYEVAIPRCRTIVVPGRYHYPMTDQPAIFVKELVEFLDGARSEK
jgi:pimeloyl-ACP methyl ester carboxylesterase